MIEHSFGGNWTEDKLSRLKNYLTAYRTIFTKNERAKFFTTWYVDAFAGTGSRSSADASSSYLTLLADVYEDADTNRYRDGSAKIALGLESPFDKYLFIEKSKSRFSELEKVIGADFALLANRCEFR